MLQHRQYHDDSRVRVGVDILLARVAFPPDTRNAYVGLRFHGFF